MVFEEHKCAWELTSAATDVHILENIKILNGFHYGVNGRKYYKPFLDFEHVLPKQKENQHQVN